MIARKCIKDLLDIKQKFKFLTLISDLACCCNAGDFEEANQSIKNIR